jgi:uncharacterized protein (DUF433 family)
MRQAKARQSMNIAAKLSEFELVGRGLYTVAEACQMTGIPTATFRRWVFGYVRRRNAERVEYRPISPPEIGRIEGHLVVGFRDLLEVRIVHAFRMAGVSWHVIRLAAANASRPGRTHPFLSERFRTDGRTIFLESFREAGEERLVDLARNQHAFHRVIAPSLRDVLFEGDEPRAWYPLWPRKMVVVDPTRSFGRPIAGGVPTDILAQSAARETSLDVVARWYEVPLEAVRAAVDWQERLAA